MAAACADRWDDAWSEAYEAGEMQQARRISEWLRVEASRLAVRASPSTSAPIVDVLREGAIVRTNRVEWMSGAPWARLSDSELVHFPGAQKLDEPAAWAMIDGTSIGLSALLVPTTAPPERAQRAHPQERRGLLESPMAGARKSDRPLDPTLAAKLRDDGTLDDPARRAALEAELRVALGGKGAPARTRPANGAPRSPAAARSFDAATASAPRRRPLDPARGVAAPQLALGGRVREADDDGAALRLLLGSLEEAAAARSSAVPWCGRTERAPAGGADAWRAGATDLTPSQREQIGERFDELAGLAHGRRGELSARLEEMGLGVGQRVQTEAAILAILRSEPRGEPDD